MLRFAFLFAFVQPEAGAAKERWLSAFGKDVRPMTDFRSSPSTIKKPGVRHFSHHEEYRHSDGSDLRFSWEVDADPESILSVDVSHRNGVRVLACEPNRLQLRVPGVQEADVLKWKSVVSSFDLHQCAHLQKSGKHLYHKVLKVERMTPLAHPITGYDVTLMTEAHKHWSHIFHRARYNYGYVPAAVKTPKELRQQRKGPFARRLQAAGIDTAAGQNQQSPFYTAPTPAVAAAAPLLPGATTPAGGTTWSFDTDTPTVNGALGGTGFAGLPPAPTPPGEGEDGLPDPKVESLDDAIVTSLTIPDNAGFSQLTPTNQEVDSIFNDNAAKPLSTIHWNWNYDIDAQDNPEFSVQIPGADGWMKFYKPYVKAVMAIEINHTSDVAGGLGSPTVDINSRMYGDADMKLDVATAVDFYEDAEMDPDKAFELPLVSSNTEWDKKASINIAGAVVKFAPGFSCKMQVYHKGQLHGSLRVSLDTKLKLDGLSHFNTVNGLTTNMTLKAQDVKFTPPTWAIFTKHFEMGVVMEPEAWVELDTDNPMLNDAKFGYGFRPWVNISIMQEGQENIRASDVGATPTGMDALTDIPGPKVVVYPYRVVGLPANNNYAIQIQFHGQTKTSSYHTSIDGVIDFDDKLESFLFSGVSSAELLSTPFNVSILQNTSGIFGAKQDVYTAPFSCTSMMTDSCSVDKVTITAGSSTVTVMLATKYSNDPVDGLTSKIKGLDFTVPKLSGFTSTVGKSVLQQMQANPSTIQFLMVRNGKPYELPMTLNGSVISSPTIYNLGLRFMDAWQQPMGIKPKISLYVNKNEVATSDLPPVSFTNNMQVQQMTGLFNGASNFIDGTVSTQRLPITLSLYEPNNPSSIVCTGEMAIDAVDPTEGAYWIRPYQATTVSVGETYTLYWTKHVSLAKSASLYSGGSMTFTLGADDLAGDYTTARTTWEITISSGCGSTDEPEIHTYTTNSALCIFSNNWIVPAELTGRTVALRLGWTDDNGVPHKMLSWAVHVQAARRRLFDLSNPFGGAAPTPTPIVAPPVGVAATVPPPVVTAPVGVVTAAPVSGLQVNQVAAGQNGLGFGGTGANSQEDFAAHLATLNQNCTGHTLKYGASYGVMEKQDLSDSPALQAAAAMAASSSGSVQTGLTPQSMMMQAMTGMMGSGMGATSSSSQSSYDHTPYGGAPAPSAAQPIAGGTDSMLMTPMQLVHSVFGTGSTDTPKTTQYTPVTTFGSSTNATLKDLLPESVCSGGLCEGESPGCQQEAVNPIEIKQIVFKLSRQFSIKDIFGQRNAGDAIAYGLALMPEAVQVSQQAVQSAAESPTTAPGRRLNRHDTPLKGFGESDTLVTTIVKPMHYRFDEYLIRKIIKNGGFSLLSDGREKTHGPVHIEAFHLRDHPGMHPTQNRFTSLAVGSVSAVAVFAVGYFVFQATTKTIRYEAAPNNDQDSVPA